VLEVSYQKHAPIGDVCQPDFILPEKIAVFADGDYWHANPCLYSQETLDEAQRFNVERDKSQNATLRENGWRVVRFWENELENDKDKCLEVVRNVINGLA
jgi:DNA mismatch endonuclease (patch repair protein)